MTACSDLLRGSEYVNGGVWEASSVGFLPGDDPRVRATVDAIGALAGEVGKAREVFGRAAAFANDLGLLAEQAGGKTGELLGNFPQAFSHVGLVNAAWAIAQAEAVGRAAPATEALR